MKHRRPPALMPLREQHAAVPALVLRVLEAEHQVRDAAEAGDEAEERGPAADVMRGVC